MHAGKVCIGRVVGKGAHARPAARTTLQPRPLRHSATPHADASAPQPAAPALCHVGVFFFCVLFVWLRYDRSCGARVFDRYREEGSRLSLDQGA